MAGVVLLDQISKFVVARQKLFHLKVIQNPGLPFGIDLPGFFDLAVVAVSLIIFLILYLHSSPRGQTDPGFALIVGGAVSNLIDRLPDGTVMDFINIGVSTLNVADIAIMVGIIWLFIAICYKKSTPRQ